MLGIAAGLYGAFPVVCLFSIARYDLDSFDSFLPVIGWACLPAGLAVAPMWFMGRRRNQEAERIAQARQDEAEQVIRSFGA